MSPLSFQGLWLGIARMQADGTLPEWAIDYQERSRKSRERVLGAAYGLIAEEGDFTMEGLADRSGLSVGALYARFPSKGAVWSLLGLAVMEDGYLKIEGAIRECTGAQDTLHAYLSTVISLFRRHRSVIRMLRQLRSESPDLAKIVNRANDRIHELLRGRIRPFLREEKHEALEYALFFASAAAREGVLYDALASYRVEEGDLRLETEVHAALSAYLGLDRP